MLVRASLAAALLFGMGDAIRFSIAAWYAESGEPDAMRKALQWDPRNPNYLVAQARQLEYSLDGGDAQKALPLYERATELSPDGASTWAELGGAYERAGREKEALQAYERARRLFPLSPRVNWLLGNFLVRAGRSEEALEPLRVVVRVSPELRRPAFELIWQSGVRGAEILARMMPEDGDPLFSYLYYLVETKRLEEAMRVWSRILELHIAFEVSQPLPYLDALLAARRLNELAEAWAVLGERFPDRIRRDKENLIFNGDFDSELINGGLDWHIVPTPEAAVEIDAGVMFNGTHPLKVRFNGQDNLDYDNVREYVIVQPDASYHFSGFLKTREITSDSGLRFEIADADSPERLSLSTENITGSAAWTLEELNFHTGKETRLLMICLLRLPSRKLSNLLSGTVWMDHLRLTRVQ